MTRILLAACACVLSISVCAGPSRWSSNGPYGGRVDAAVVSATQPNIVFVAAQRNVFRSIDGGQSWTLRSAGLDNIASGEIVLRMHPTDPDRLSVAGARGVFLTVDGGRNWRRSNTGLPTGSSSFKTVDIAYSPINPLRMFLATESNGVYRSTNGGQTWTQPAATGPAPTEPDRIAVFDPGTGVETVLVWTGQRNQILFPSSLYRSTDGGTNYGGISGPWAVVAATTETVSLLASNPQSPNTIFLAGRFGNFRSTNGGVSFTASTLPIAASQRWQGLAAATGLSTTLIFGTSHGVLASVDNGLTFTPRNSGLDITPGTLASIGPVLIAPNNASRWFAFSLAGDTYVSTNSGGSWAPSNIGLRGVAINDVVAHPTQAQLLFAGVRNTRRDAAAPALLRSTDGADTWVPQIDGLLLDSVNRIVFDPATTATVGTTKLFALGADFAPLSAPEFRGGVFVSVNGGAAWSPSDVLSPNPQGGAAGLGEVFDLSIQPGSVLAGQSQRLHFAARGALRCQTAPTPILDGARVWRSLNGGSSYSPRDGLPLGVCQPRLQYPVPVALATGGGTSTTLFAGLRLDGYCRLCNDPVPTQPTGVYRIGATENSWTRVSNGLPRMGGVGSTWDITALVSAPNRPGTLYAALRDPTLDDGTGRIFRTVDNGDNWEAADNGIVGRAVRGLWVDPTDGGRLLAAVSGDVLSTGGVYASDDGGQSWASLSIDMPTDSANAVTVASTVPPTLHAGTGEGVFSLTRLPDGDRDGPGDAVEDLAPNNGDGNSDGIPDRTQTNVASFFISGAANRGAPRQGSLTNIDLRRGASCQQVYDVAAIDPEAFTQDGDFRFDAGLLRFEFENCSQAQVEIIFHAETFGPSWQFRRYGPATAGDPLSLRWLSMGTDAQRNGNRWTLLLRDNEPGDLRRESNRILFVGGPGQITPLFRNGFE